MKLCNVISIFLIFLIIHIYNNIFNTFYLYVKKFFQKLWTLEKNNFEEKN